MLAALVPSYDTCRALATAGFPQRTVVSWIGRGPLSAPVLRAGHTASPVRRGAVAAPTLDEVLAQLPERVSYTVPHPIYGTVERSHRLRMDTGAPATLGYHLPGSFDVKHRSVHVRAAEAAARLYLTLHASGKLGASEPAVERPARALVRAA